MSVKVQPDRGDGAGLAIAAPSPRPSRLLAALGLLALAIVQVIWCGYSIGVGNQSIQVPFLRKSADPSLFARDLMVNSTMADYPSAFFRGLALVIGGGDVRLAYFILHVATAFAVLAAVYALGIAMGHSRLAGIIAVLLVLAGHHRALGGDELYAAGFTHTFAVLPLAIACLALFYRGWPIAACLMAGAIFNLHALMAAYLVAMIGFAAAIDLRRTGIVRLLAMVIAFAALAAPTGLMMLRQHHTFDQQWIVLTNIRSAAHSLPTTWWAVGNPEIPRFVLILAIGVMALSFLPAGQRRRSVAIVAAAMILFVVGLVFSEQWPVPAVMRAQLFRSSRLLLVLMLVQAACAMAWVLRHSLPSARGHGAPPDHRWRARLELLAWTGAFVALGFAPALHALPLAVALCAAIGLVSGRISTVQASAVAAAIIVTAIANKTIQFPIPGLGGDFAAVGHGWWGDLALMGIGLSALALVRVPWPKWASRLASFAALLVCFALGRWATTHYATPPADDKWVDVQRWAAANTGPDSLFLTTIRPGGFRLHSSRAVVAEWRDGTQAYFNPDFGAQWWQRILDLQPGIEADATGRHMLAPGRALSTLPEADLLHLCRKYGASHIVLPSGAKRQLWRVYDNGAWAVYVPKWPPGRDPRTRLREAIAGAMDDAWLDIKCVVLANFWGPHSEKYQQWMMDNLVRRNIDRYRKSQIVLEVFDPAGQRIENLAFEIRQTRQAFNFSASLPFFEKPAAPSAMGDYHPPPVIETELNRFLEIFNTSLIPFSGKWMYIEPVEGKRCYDELDKYVAWAARNNIALEFHFLSGYPARWLRTKPSPQQAELFRQHALDLVRRYGDRIKYWQVVNEAILLEHSPAVFREIRQIAPDLKLGIADCSRFWTDSRGRYALRDRNRGLDKLQWLKSRGVKIDYFGFHGHRPFGLWASAQDIYDSLDTFAAEGVKIHITEFTCPQDVPIVGGVQRGLMTPEMQARWYARAWEVCFSHPNVELINLWGVGPNTWQPGGGLLNDQYQPRPSFDAMKDLIQTRLRTNFTDKLPPNRPATFRAFHGDYQLSITLPTGHTVRTRFTSDPGGPTHIRLKLDARAATLTDIP